MTIDEAIHVLIAVQRYPTNIKGKDAAIDMAIDALHARQEADKNEPLTLEELRKMDGEPVWAELADGRREYGLVSVEEFGEMIYICLLSGFFLAFNHGVPNKPFWSNLFRHKPEEEAPQNKEAWRNE